MVFMMNYVSADIELKEAARKYLENLGMEVTTASPPFVFLAHFPNNPSALSGIGLVAESQLLSPASLEQIAAAAAQSGMARVMMFTGTVFSPEISRAALQHRVSLIDRGDLQTQAPSPVPPPPMPRQEVHSSPPTRAGSRRTPPPIPVLSPLYPLPPKPRRSFGGQLAILMVALVIGRASLTMIYDQAKENFGGSETFGGSLPSLISKPKAKTYVLPVNENSPTFENSRAEKAMAYSRELYRFNEITDPGLKALADDFLAKEGKRIPKVYLSHHQKAILENWTGLIEHPGLALLVVNLLPRRADRTTAYEWLIPALEELGDSRLIYIARAQRAEMTRLPEERAEAMSSLKEMLNDFGNGVYLIEQHTDDILSNHGEYLFESSPEEVLSLVESSEGVPTWFKKLLRGKYHLDSGWNARGTGYAKTVSDSQWKVFNRELTLAEKAFRESWDLHQHPYSGSQLISISMNLQNDRETRLWFEKTLSIRADYGIAYYNYMSSLMPRWGGSNEETKAFGKACLTPVLEGTDVSFLLVTAHMNRSVESGNKKNYWKMMPEDEKSEILQMIDRQLAANPHPAFQRYYLSLKMAMFHLFGRYEETANLFGLLGKDVDGDAYANLPLKDDDIINALLMNGIPVTFAKNPE